MLLLIIVTNFTQTENQNKKETKKWPWLTIRLASLYQQGCIDVLFCFLKNLNFYHFIVR